MLKNLYEILTNAVPGRSSCPPFSSLSSDNHFSSSFHCYVWVNHEEGCVFYALFWYVNPISETEVTPWKRKFHSPNNMGIQTSTTSDKNYRVDLRNFLLLSNPERKINHLLKKIIYLFEKEWERERESTRGERVRERSSLPPWAGSLTQGLILGLWDHELSWKQIFNRLSHLGTPFHFYVPHLSICKNLVVFVCVSVFLKSY